MPKKRNTKPTPLKLPKGYEPPKDLQDGDTYEFVGTAKKDGENHVMTHMDGMPMDDGDSERDQQENPDDEDDTGHEQDGVAAGIDAPARSVGSRVMAKAKSMREA